MTHGACVVRVPPETSDSGYKGVQLRCLQWAGLSGSMRPIDALKYCTNMLDKTATGILIRDVEKAPNQNCE